MIKKLTGAALAAAVLFTPARSAPKKSYRTKAELNRVVMERGLIASWANICLLDSALTSKQFDYLAKLSEYEAQRYLLGIDGIGIDACKRNFIDACEGNSPGDCIAVPGEVNGRRP